MLCVLTVWVVAVRVPSLILVQSVAVTDDAHLPEAAVWTSLDDGVTDVAFVKPACGAHVEA